MQSDPHNEPANKPIPVGSNALLLLTFVFWLFVVYFMKPDGGDWWLLFSQADILDPYATRRFISPPFIPVLVSPFKLFGSWSLAVMMALTATLAAALVRDAHGKIDLFSLAAVYTSYPFMALIHTGQIEWIPLLGLATGGWLGAALIAMKPQAGLLAGLVWFIRSDQKLAYITMAVGLLSVSFLIWGNWPASMLANMAEIPDTKRWPGIMGVSIWPWGIPIGVALLVDAIRQAGLRNATVLAILATLMLTPYFNVQSMVGLIALAFPMIRKRAVLIAWILLWLIPFVY